jgi:hypothetical protein
MFFFSKKPKSKKTDDKVWFNKTGKYTDIHNLARSNQNLGITTFIVSWFKDTQDEICESLIASNTDYKPLTDGTFHSGNLLSGKQFIFVMDASLFDHDLVLQPIFKNLSDKEPVFLYSEHYPLYSKEENCIRKMEQLTGSKCSYGFYVSFDEPILKFFGGDRIIDMMKSMGMNENESISHSMITKSIINAQKKLEKKIVHEFTADSSEKWFKLNVKEI